MNINDLDKDLNSFPEDLKYSEENWEGALAGIEAYEKKKRRRAIIAYSSLTTLIGIAALVFFLNKDANEKQISEAKEVRKEQITDTTITSQPEYSSELEGQIKEEIVLETKSSSLTKNQKGKKTISNKTSELHSVPNYKSDDKTTTDADFNPSSQSTSENMGVIVAAIIPAKSATSGSNFEPSTNSETNFDDLAENSELDSKEVDVALSSDANLGRMTVGKIESIQLKNDRVDGDLAHRDFEMTFPDYSRDHLYVKLGTAPWTDFGKNNFSLKDFTIGLAYTRKLNSKWTIGTGLDYFIVNDLPQYVIRTEVQYLYGYDSTVTSLLTDRLHYFSVPIGALYKVNDRLELSAAIGASYMFWTENTLNVRKTSYEEGELNSSRQTSGYLNTFKQYNMFVQTGATYSLNDKLCIGADFQFGLNDITPNEIFMDNSFDRNSRAVVYLKHRLW